MSNNNRFINDYDLSDTIDLNTVLTNDHSKIHPSINMYTKKRNSYNISLDSITDEELQNITRSLITPIPFQQSMEIKTNNTNAPFAEVPTFRSESAYIFNYLHNDDDISVDFAQSDLKDFIDPVLLEGVISRPVSRVPLQLQRDTQNPMNQIDNPHVISKKHLLNSLETQPTDDVNILTTQYNKMNIKRKGREVNTCNTEKEVNIMYQNNGQLLDGITGYKQNYGVEDKLSIKPSIRRKHQINSSSTKRHSLNVQTLTSRRDRDQSFQNRQSLKLHHISKTDDATTKKPFYKTTTYFDETVPEKQVQNLPSFNSDKHLSPRLLPSDKRKGINDAKFQSNLPQFEQYVHYGPALSGLPNSHDKANKLSLPGAGDQQSSTQKNRTVRRYRSVSFPDQNKNKEIYNNSYSGKESSKDSSITFSFIPKHSQSGQNRRQVFTTEKLLKINQHRNAPEFEKIDISSQDIKTFVTQNFEKNPREPLSSSSSSSPSLLPTRRLPSKQNKYNPTNRAMPQHNDELYKISKSVSVTESAKNVLENIRQRRASSYQQQVYHDQSKKINPHHKGIR